MSEIREVKIDKLSVNSEILTVKKFTLDPIFDTVLGGGGTVRVRIRLFDSEDVSDRDQIYFSDALGEVFVEIPLEAGVKINTEGPTPPEITLYKEVQRAPSRHQENPKT